VRVELATRRVLLVDDEADLRKLLRLVLERSGRYEVVAEAEDGARALELAEVHRPEVVLLDLSMPRLDGLETLPRLRALLPDARVVVLSGYAAHGAAGPATQAGADVYLEKGLSPPALLEAIDRTAAGSDAPAPTPHVGRPDPRPPAADEVVARLAHDVRSPLATATGAVELVRRSVGDDVGPDLADLLDRASTSLARVEETLAAAIEHARSGRARLDLREVPVGPLVDDLLAGLPQGADRVTVLGDHDAQAFVDPGALQRVLTNVVGNALRYSDAEVVVRLTNGDGALTVTVEDRGPGLGPDPDALFEPFVRGPAAGSREGSGLGLPTAVELLRRMRGDISGQDREGGGAEFRVVVPGA
jgi:signal transduction histidine kinase